MTSLTETAYYTRKTINWVILGIIAYFLLRILWSVLIVVWLAVFPPKAPPPNHAFGKLPAMKFPPQATPTAQLTFQLETIEGSVPRASESATVYFMPKNAPNLLALNETEEFAKRLQFDPTPIQESKNIYRFNDPQLPLRRMRFDIVSKNFIVRYGFEQDTSVLTERNLPLSESAKLEALTLLESNNLNIPDIAGGSSAVTFLRLAADRLIPTTSLSQADAVRVDFFRRAIGDMRVLTPTPDEAPVSIVFSGSSNTRKRMLQFAYTFWPIDYHTTATYALKSSDVAWAELQAGRGYIARYPSSGAIAVVRNASLGYYDSFEPQTYLQPIFVFEGDNGFVAYVPAVTPEWTE